MGNDEDSCINYKVIEYGNMTIEELRDYLKKRIRNPKNNRKGAIGYFEIQGAVNAYKEILGLLEEEDIIPDKKEVQKHYIPYWNIKSNCCMPAHVIYDTEQKHTFCSQCNKVQFEGKPDDK